MKYIVKQNPINVNSFTPLHDYLTALGITKVSSFLNAPDEIDELSPFLLNNMQKGIEMLNKHIERKSEIMVIVDSDADGYTSSAIIYNYIHEKLGHENISFFIHEGKEHGVVPAHVPFGVDLVIIPDAGSNQIEELEELIGRHIDILVLDHHLVDDFVKHEKVVIINNQMSMAFDNKDLSGAGVTFKFVQAYSSRYGQEGDAEQYYDLAALGILSDMMWAGNLDNNYIIKKGLSNVKNKMFRAMLEFQSFSIGGRVENPTLIDVAFYITPLINGTIRFGDMETKELLFSCLANNSLTDTIESVTRGKEREETMYEYAARAASNTRARQNKSLENIMIEMSEYIENNNLQHNQLIIVPTDKIDQVIPQTVTGLVAMKITAKYNRPALVVRPVNDNGVLYYRGSGRGLNNSRMESLKNELDASGYCDYVSGHDNAFGVGFKQEHTAALLEFMNKELIKYDFGDVVTEVDYACIGRISTQEKNALLTFASYQGIFGNGITEPKFAFEFSVAPVSVKFMGQDGSTIKFTVGDTQFVKFKDKALAEEINNMETSMMKVKIIGKPNLNIYNGKTNLQISCTEVEVTPIHSEDLL